MAETYRGVPVPRDLLPNTGTPEYFRWRFGVVSALDFVLPLIEALTDNQGECATYGEAVCQNHPGLDGVCLVGALRDFVSVARRGERVWLRETSADTLAWCYLHRPAFLGVELVSVSELETDGGYCCVQCGRELKAR
jgi:hypothetical protein